LREAGQWGLPGREVKISPPFGRRKDMKWAAVVEMTGKGAVVEMTFAGAISKAVILCPKGRNLGATREGE